MRIDTEKQKEHFAYCLKEAFERTTKVPVSIRLDYVVYDNSYLIVFSYKTFNNKHYSFRMYIEPDNQLSFFDIWERIKGNVSTNVFLSNERELFLE